MEIQRTILIFASGFCGLLLWQTWQRDYGAPLEPPVVPAAEEPIALPGANRPVASPRPDLPELPEEDRSALALLPDRPAATEQALIQVSTDVLNLRIDPQGGIIRYASLPKFPVAVERPDEPLVLLDSNSQDHSQIQGGILSRQQAPTHEARFQVDQERYELQREKLTVPLYWMDEAQNLRVEKNYTFHQGSYLVDVSYQVHNVGEQPWQGRAYSQLQRSEPNVSWSLWQPIRSYIGAALSSPEDPYQRIDFSDMGKQALNQTIPGGWAAFLQHYFLSALIPVSQAPYHYYTLTPGNNLYIIGSIAPALSLAPGEKGTALGHRLYIGPKYQDQLAEIAPNLNLTIDYGWLWIISHFLFVILSWFHGWVGNWGVAIILLTALVKLAFYPLSALGYRSMAKMRHFQPKITALQQRYGDDRAGMQKALMQLYRQEKINPFQGCLPILVQIPVFIALYWVLLEGVELRQAGFIGWIQDLSLRDRYFILPLLMGVTMLLQQKLSPKPPDPVQQKIMSILPIVFTLFIAFFPSGLVLYMLVNSLLSILQQWYVNSRLGLSLPATRGADK